MIVLLGRLANVSMNARANSLLRMSRPCKGSSRISRAGSFTSARASSNRRCSPEDNFTKERSRKSRDAECIEPAHTGFYLLGGKSAKESYRIVISRGDDFGCGNVFEIRSMYLG